MYYRVKWIVWILVKKQVFIVIFVIFLLKIVDYKYKFCSKFCLLFKGILSNYFESPNIQRIKNMKLCWWLVKFWSKPLNWLLGRRCIYRHYTILQNIKDYFADTYSNKITVWKTPQWSDLSYLINDLEE